MLALYRYVTVATVIANILLNIVLKRTTFKLSIFL